MKALKILGLIIGLLLMIFSGGCALIFFGTLASEGLSSGNAAELFSIFLEIMVFAGPVFALGFALFYLGRKGRKKSRAPGANDPRTTKE